MAKATNNQTNLLHPLFAISPLDGRYQDKVQAVAGVASEAGLMRYRILVEVEYFIALANEPKVKEVKKLNGKEQALLRSLYEQFSAADAERVKAIEAVTKHDVKAIEYFMKERLAKSSLGKRLEFVHFALTSEDVNNLAYSLMLQALVQDIYAPQVEQLVKTLKQAARKYAKQSLLSLTHGQPATPTTLGKELQVFVSRLQRQLDTLLAIELTGKFGGATGNWAAHRIAYPNINWMQFASRFITHLGLTPNLATTQIECHDQMVATYQGIVRINSIIKDFDQDMWLYISRGLFVQGNVAGEIGSSAMPHKINPIYFENSEGNVGVANALLNHLAEKLPVSRLQRDLTDSTVLRNQGSAIAYSVLAVKNTQEAWSRLQPNKAAMLAELDNHWEVLAEAIQTVMRRLGKEAPYEQLKQLTRGAQIDKNSLHLFILSLDIPDEEVEQLLALTPSKYIGYSAEVAKL